MHNLNKMNILYFGMGFAQILGEGFSFRPALAE
jgi:hypothetical protein